MTEPWYSLVLGACVGLAYVGLAYLILRFALRFTDARFMAIFFGGLLARLVLLLIVVGLMLAFTAVRPLPFAIVLIGMLIAGLGVEIAYVLRRRTRRLPDD